MTPEPSMGVLVERVEGLREDIQGLRQDLREDYLRRDLADARFTSLEARIEDVEESGRWLKRWLLTAVIAPVFVGVVVGVFIWSLHHG